MIIVLSINTKRNILFHSLVDQDNTRIKKMIHNRQAGKACTTEKKEIRREICHIHGYTGGGGKGSLSHTLCVPAPPPPFSLTGGGGEGGR